MKRSEINSLEFRTISHMSMENMHCTLYEAESGGHKFRMCKHIACRYGFPAGKSYTHYMVDGKAFKSLDKFYEYCEAL